MSAFTPSGSGGSVGSTVLVGSTNPTVANINMPLAATEYSYVLPTNTKKFYIQLRDPSAELKLAYAAGTSGTTYVTVHRGCWFGEADLSVTGVTLYFQSSVSSQTAEIVSWT